MRLLLGFAALLLVMPASASMAAPPQHWWQEGPRLPKLTGRVVDEAGLLADMQRADLTAMLAQLEVARGHQFVIVTVASLNGQTIEHLGIRLGRTWGIGRKHVDDGVLLIVAPHERKVRIEVGYGLEKPLSDPVCAKIIRERILPRFRAGDMAGGIRAGAVAIIERLSGGKS